MSVLERVRALEAQGLVVEEEPRTDTLALDLKREMVGRLGLATVADMVSTSDLEQARAELRRHVLLGVGRAMLLRNRLPRESQPSERQHGAFQPLGRELCLRPGAHRQIQQRRVAVAALCQQRGSLAAKFLRLRHAVPPFRFDKF